MYGVTVTLHNLAHRPLLIHILDLRCFDVDNKLIQHGVLKDLIIESDSTQTFSGEFELWPEAHGRIVSVQAGVRPRIRL